MDKHIVELAMNKIEVDEASIEDLQKCVELHWNEHKVYNMQKSESNAMASPVIDIRPIEEVKPVEVKQEVKPVEVKQEVKPVEVKQEVKPMEVKQEVKPMEVKPVEVKQEVKPVEVKPASFTQTEVKPVEMPIPVEPQKKMTFVEKVAAGLNLKDSPEFVAVPRGCKIETTGYRYKNEEGRAITVEYNEIDRQAQVIARDLLKVRTTSIYGVWCPALKMRFHVDYSPVVASSKVGTVVDLYVRFHRGFVTFSFLKKE